MSERKTECSAERERFLAILLFTKLSDRAVTLALPPGVTLVKEGCVLTPLVR